ncbi:MAG TPA: hypothetical protein VF026_11345 [Ktedonobacteraceae bacterium]
MKPAYSSLDRLVVQTQHPSLVGFVFNQPKPRFKAFWEETLAFPDYQGRYRQEILIDEIMGGEQPNEIRAAIDEEQLLALAQEAV